MTRPQMTDAQIEERFMKKKAGRPASPAPASKEVPINEALVRADFDAATQLGVQQQAAAQQELADLCELAGDVGALRALELTRSFVAAATVQLFNKVRESKQINKLPIRMPDGAVATATTVDEFCRLVFGKPRTAMIEASETLEVLGEAAYEMASRLGLNRAALRATRALPPEKLVVVRAAIGNGSTKAEVLSVIEDLAEKVQRAEAATAEAEAELKASEGVVAAKSERINKLERDLQRIRRLPPDQALADLKKAATAVADDADGAVWGGLTQALKALREHDGGQGGNDVFMAGLVGQVQARLNWLRQEFNLPDVSSAADAQLAAEMEEWDRE